MKNKAYSALAGVYENLMEVDYDEWAKYVADNVKKYAPGSSGADVGCGSGAFTRRFRRMGFDVYGCDLSEEMLTVAARLSREEGLDITFVRQDARAFTSPRRLHFITALTDCVNYLNADDMKKAFKRFAKSLVKGGVLFFDISSEYKLKSVIADNMFAGDYDDYAYLWFNRPFGGGVEMDITLFNREENGLFSRKDEHHVQYIHTEAEVTAALNDAGFEVISVEGHLGAPVKDDCERLNFIAARR